MISYCSLSIIEFHPLIYNYFCPGNKKLQQKEIYNHLRSIPTSCLLSLGYPSIKDEANIIPTDLDQCKHNFLKKDFCLYHYIYV